MVLKENNYSTNFHKEIYSLRKPLSHIRHRLLKAHSITAKASAIFIANLQAKFLIAIKLTYIKKLKCAEKGFRRI